MIDGVEEDEGGEETVDKIEDEGGAGGEEDEEEREVEGIFDDHAVSSASVVRRVSRRVWASA
eukprot:5311561-Pleurochrysis_carterae.AAC.1